MKTKKADTVLLTIVRGPYGNRTAVILNDYRIAGTYQLGEGTVEEFKVKVSDIRRAIEGEEPR